MSLGSWDPQAADAAANCSINAALLQQFIRWSREEALDSLSELMGDDVQGLAPLMHLEAAEWQQAAEPLSDEDIRHLVRFFAMAENLPGWEAAEKSPVIPLAKVLRGRGDRLDREFLLWLRGVNDNRFLPYGPL